MPKYHILFRDKRQPDVVKGETFETLDEMTAMEELYTKYEIHLVFMSLYSIEELPTLFKYHNFEPLIKVADLEDKLEAENISKLSP